MSGSGRLDPLFGGPSQDLIALGERAQGSFVGRCTTRFLRMAGIDRCIVLSSQAFTALIPLLIVLAALAPSDDDDATADAIIRRFGLSGDSAAAVQQLFATSGEATAGLGIASTLLLLVSGVSFARRLQTMYRSAWDRESLGIRGPVFAALGLLALLAEVVVLYAMRSLSRSLSLPLAATLPLTIAAGVFLWTSIPYLLMHREVHWRRLLVAGSITAVGTAVLGWATTVYMGPLMADYTEQFGLFGITIAMIGWLLAAAGVLVVSTAVGAEFDASPGHRLGRVKLRLGLCDPALGPPEVDEAAEAAGLNANDVLLLIRVLINWGILAAAVWVATAVVPGIDVNGGFLTYFAISLLLGLVNAVMGPLLYLVALPLSVVTVGGSALVVNTVLLAVTAWLTVQMDIDGLGSAVLGALVIAIANTVLELVVRPIQKTMGERH